MNDLLKLHKTVGGNGLNKLTYREYLDEHFNLGELENVYSYENTLMTYSEDITPKTALLLHGDSTQSDTFNVIEVSDLEGNATIEEGGVFDKCINIGLNKRISVPLKLDGSTSFTIDWWEYQLTSTSGEGFINNRDRSQYGLLIAHRGTTDVYLHFSTNGSSWLSNVSGSNSTIGTVKLNTWVHRAVVYDKVQGKVYGFENGKKTREISIGNVTFPSSDNLYIGTSWGTNNLNIKIAEFRVTLDALWNSDFDIKTKPYSKTPSPDTEGYRISPPIKLPKNIVSSKIDWEGEGKINIIGLENGEIPYDIHADINDNTLIYLQGHNFKDYSNYNRELKGTNKVTFRDNAMSLNGRFLKTTTPDKTSYIKGTDFTVEFWGKCNSLPVIKWNSFFEINNETGVSSPDEFRIGLHNTTNNLIAIVGKTSHLYATPLPLNEWHHYCITRQGSTVYGFIDGVLKFQASNSQSVTGNTLYLGHNAYASDQHLDCDIKEFMVSDVCKYTSNFTPKHNSFNISEGYLIPCENGKAITSKLPRNIVLEQTIKGTEYISNVNLSIKHSKVHDVMTPTLLAEQGDSKELYLYDSGNEFEKVTGGWKGHQWDSSFPSGYYSKKDTYLEYGDNTSNYGYGGFVTNNGIDLTPYSTLWVDAEFVSYSVSSTYTASNIICICRDNVPNIRNRTFDDVHNRSNSTGRFQVEIDISNYNGVFYLGVQGQSGAYNNHTNIQRLHSMKLLK